MRSAPEASVERAVMEAPAAPAMEMDSSGGAGNAYSASVPQQEVERIVIRNVSLSLVVDDPVVSMDKVSNLADQILFMEDGSGLSPLNAINARGMVSLLHFMKTRGKHFDEFYASLPEAGKEGTLKNRFTDQVFESNLRAKSGSMTRVRSYAGYFTAKSGREMIFWTDPSPQVLSPTSVAPARSRSAAARAARRASTP